MGVARYFYMEQLYHRAWCVNYWVPGIRVFEEAGVHPWVDISPDPPLVSFNQNIKLLEISSGSASFHMIEHHNFPVFGKNYHPAGNAAFECDLIPANNTLRIFSFTSLFNSK